MGRKLPRLGRSMFYPKPRFKYLGEIVEMETPEEARSSVRQLWREFRSAKTRQKKMRIWRAADLAWKRAEATLKREHLSARERKEFRIIAKIYKQAANKMHRLLKRAR